MNDLCTDIGFMSVNKFGEQLCGDHVEVIDQSDDSHVVVLADGLGSGVKASILSTLTSTIISTMVANGMSLESCVDTIAATLPICEVRKVAYSTFTIVRTIDNREAEIIQYDNPKLILLRDGKSFDYPQTETKIDGKTIYKTKIDLHENDFLVFTSDGAIWAGVGTTMNFGWQREEIVEFLEKMVRPDFTAKTVSSLLLDECCRLYGGKPGDDTTVCTVKIRRRKSVNLLFGPPRDPKDVHKMMTLFFAKEGKHIVSGGTTSTLAGEFLGKPVETQLDYLDPDIPPIAKIEGVDLVTEGVITMSRVLEYANGYGEADSIYADWSVKEDGASRIARLLLEEATDVNFFVGTAVNPAHQNPDLPINFNIKMHLVEELSERLKSLGKRVKVSYF